MGNPILTPQQVEYRERAQAAAATLYRKAGLPAPKDFVWFRSPFSLCSYISAHPERQSELHKVLLPPDYNPLAAAPIMERTGRFSFRRINPFPLIAQVRADNYKVDNNVCFFSSALPLMESFYINNDINMNERQRLMLRAQRQAASTLDVIAPYATECLLSDLAVKTNLDAQGRFHSLTEAAAVYADGWKVFAVDGAVAPGWCIEQPHRITQKLIDECGDFILRRLLMRLYPGDYYADCNATRMVTDDIGSLYRKPRANDTDIVFVRVRNSTREPDGTFRDYVLRVPPRIGTPLEAVAWTFDMTPEEYLKTQRMT